MVDPREDRCDIDFDFEDTDGGRSLVYLESDHKLVWVSVVILPGAADHDHCMTMVLDEEILNCTCGLELDLDAADELDLAHADALSDLRDWQFKHHCTCGLSAYIHAPAAAADFAPMSLN